MMDLPFLQGDTWLTEFIFGNFVSHGEKIYEYHAFEASYNFAQKNATGFNIASGHKHLI